MTNFRPCGDCNACCSWLIGNAFGWEFGCGKSCKFLEDNKCGVHKARPEVCRNYQCAWSQYLLPEEMRPDKSGVLVSVEMNEREQYLKAISINNKKMDDNIKKSLMMWSEKMNVSIIISE
jgi:Fe-S-cluster containining protein